MSSLGKFAYSGKTQAKGSGVSWYNHVSCKCMIPYGIKKRDDDFEDIELHSIMKSNTCELLCRPSVSISEFGEALEMCPPMIKNLLWQVNLDDVVDHQEEMNVQQTWKLSSGTFGNRFETSHKIYDRTQR